MHDGNHHSSQYVPGSMGRRPQYVPGSKKKKKNGQVDHQRSILIEHVCRNVSRHVYRHVYRRVYRHVMCTDICRDTHARTHARTHACMHARSLTCRSSSYTLSTAAINFGSVAVLLLGLEHVCVDMCASMGMDMWHGCLWVFDD